MRSGVLYSLMRFPGDENFSSYSFVSTCRDYLKEMG